jgi:hypothetical protein
VLVLALLACGPKLAPVAAPVRAFAPAPHVVEYDVRVDVGNPAIDQFVRHFRDTWGPATAGAGMTTWDVVTEEKTAEGWTRRSAARMFLGADGVGYLGNVEADGSFVAWNPPKVLLPPDPAVGDAWSATHHNGERMELRTCELAASDYCAGGLVAVCDVDRSVERLVFRDHYCKDVGWSGFELLVTRPGTNSQRQWSENVVRDGVPAPKPK